MGLIALRHDMNVFSRIDSLTLSHLLHRGHRDELYGNHIHIDSECYDYDYSIYPNVGYHC